MLGIACRIGHTLLLVRSASQSTADPTVPKKVGQVGLIHWLVPVVVGLTAVAGLGYVDLLSGPHFGMSLFYLLPVLAVAWARGVRASLVVAVAASAAWLAADRALQEQIGLAVSIWNGVTRLTIFSVVGVLTAVIVRDRLRLKEALLASEVTARTDAVTGLANLRAFVEEVDIEVARCRRQNRPACVIYIDLDNFKKVNDLYGHQAGNEALGRIASVLVDERRKEDLVARLGGDEFGLILTNADQSAAEDVAQRIVDGVAGVASHYPGSALGASAGVALFCPADGDAQAILRTADDAMYEAKAQGKGQVVIREQASPPPS